MLADELRDKADTANYGKTMQYMATEAYRQLTKYISEKASLGAYETTVKVGNDYADQFCETKGATVMLSNGILHASLRENGVTRLANELVSLLLEDGFEATVERSKGTSGYKYLTDSLWTITIRWDVKK